MLSDAAYLLAVEMLTRQTLKPPETDSGPSDGLQASSLLAVTQG